MGGHHKFKDYYQGMDMPYEYLEWTPKTNIDTIIQNCLLRCSDNYIRNKKLAVTDEMQKILLKINA